MLYYINKVLQNVFYQCLMPSMLLIGQMLDRKTPAIDLPQEKPSPIYCLRGEKFLTSPSKHTTFH